MHGPLGEVTESDPAAVAAFTGNQRAGCQVPHRVSCRVSGMSESWLYRWRNKPTTAREVRRGKLIDTIRKNFAASGGTCGSAKIWILLVHEGRRVSLNTAAKLMAEPGPAGPKIRRRRGLTRPGKRAAFPDFVRRDLCATAPDRVWCGDTTELVTGEGKLYVACVTDLFSRRLPGYPATRLPDGRASRRRTRRRFLEHVVASLNMAATTRGGDVKGVIFPSDRGSEYQRAVRESMSVFGLGAVRAECPVAMACLTHAAR
jgi:putative transposase